MQTIPTRRKAYCFDPATKKCAWQDLEIPPLPDNFILVKVESAAIVPMDFTFMSGAPFMGFGVGPGPHVLGAQGAGTVVAHGPGKGHAFLGKKVSIMPARPGVWADYSIVHINDAIILDDKTSWEDAANAMSYPLTALMLLDLAKRLQAKAVISTAANSTIGRMVLKLFQNNGIEVINLIRRADKAAQIAAEGARYILNTTDAEFEKKLVELCAKLHVNLVLEAIGGESLAKIASLAPPGSSICVYGSLANQQISAITNADLFQGKILMAANVFAFWGRLHSEEKVKQVECINRELTTTFKTTALKVVSFNKIEEGLKSYEENKKGPSQDGKIILRWQ